MWAGYGDAGTATLDLGPDACLLPGLVDTHVHPIPHACAAVLVSPSSAASGLIPNAATACGTACGRTPCGLVGAIPESLPKAIRTPASIIPRKLPRIPALRLAMSGGAGSPVGSCRRSGRRKPRCS